MTLDIMSNFPFLFTTKYKVIWKENLVVNQTSPRAFFHTPLQFPAILTEQFWPIRGHYMTVNNGARVKLGFDMPLTNL